MKIKLLSVLLMSSLVFTACSTSTPTDAKKEGTSTPSEVKKTDAPQQKVDLRVMWWGDQARADLTLKVIDLFQQKNPNIKVTPEYIPIAGYFDKLDTQLAAASAPDIFTLGSNIFDYQNKGVLLPLDPYVGKELNTSDMNKGMIDYSTYSGKLYAMPLGVNSRGILINKSVFEKAGIALPKENWTWDDYAKISNDISQKLGKGYFGTYNLAIDESALDMYMKQTGKITYNSDEKKLGFDKQDLIQWFTYWEQLRKSSAAITPDLQVSNPQGDTGKSLLLTGKVAMQIVASNLLGSYQANTKDPLLLFPFPSGSKGRGTSLDPSMSMVVYKNSQHPKEAAQFLNFWENDPEAAKILGTNRGVPVSSKIRDSLKSGLTPIDLEVYNYIDVVDKGSKDNPVKPSIGMPGSNEFMKLYETTVEEVSFGKTPVETAASYLMTEIQKIIDKQLKK